MMVPISWKVKGWMSELGKVYNRGLQVTQGKVFLGGVDHDYTKAGVDQIR